MKIVRSRVRRFLVHNILHLDDTPHRIALGVGIGLFVAFTPTIGLQMVIGALLATLLRANKIPAVGLAWLTNPVTIVPVFYFNWCVGHALLSGEIERNETVRATLARTVAEAGGFVAIVGNVFDWSSWQKLLKPLGTIVPELVVGSLIVAFVLGAAGYVLTLRVVTRYRGQRKARKTKRAASFAKPGTVVHEAPAASTRKSA